MEKMGTSNSRQIKLNLRPGNPIPKKPAASPVKGPPLAFSSPSILITGGLGDFFAIESFFPEQLKKSLQYVFYATGKSSVIKQCFQCLPNYHVQHQDVWTDFSQFWSLDTKDQVEQVLKETNRTSPPWFAEAEDFGIDRVFGTIAHGLIHYVGSSFLNHAVADIYNVKLPSRFLTICPYSSDKRYPYRDFSAKDWETIVNYLESYGIFGVVLNDVKEYVPTSNYLKDLSGTLSVTEAIEVLKKSIGYIGIDSSLSVLAAKLFPPKSLVVKTQNIHCYNYRYIYYAPQLVHTYLMDNVHCDDFTVTAEMNPIKTTKHVPFGEDLCHCEDIGIMFQKDMEKSIEYGYDYYQHYVELIGTDVSNKLNAGRVALTKKYSTCLIDVGIGSGEFIMRSDMKVYGFDINPFGVDWLKKRDLFVNPYESVPQEVDGWTFWDVIEHIPEPQHILGLVKPGHYVYASLPIFENLLKIRDNKHFKPKEHYYYFTKHGFLWFARSLGFEPVEVSNFETKAGRSGILTFVLRKL